MSKRPMTVLDKFNGMVFIGFVIVAIICFVIVASGIME